MITDFFLDAFGGIVNGVLSLMPAWTPSIPGIDSVGTSIGSLAALWSGYFPVTTLFACLATVVSLSVFLTVWRLVLFVYHQIWGSD